MLTTLLVHGNTDFKDTSVFHHTITKTVQASVSSAQSKFGGGSLLCGSLDASTFSAPDLPEFQFGLMPYHVDFWYRPADVNAGVRILVYQGNSAGYGELYLLRDGTKFSLNMANAAGNGYMAGCPFNILNAFTINQWHYIEVSSDGVNFRVFINGLKGIDAAFVAAPNHNPGPFFFGGADGNYGCGGYIGEFHVVWDEVGHTSNYSVPVAPYSDPTNAPSTMPWTMGPILGGTPPVIPAPVIDGILPSSVVGRYQSVQFDVTSADAVIDVIEANIGYADGKSEHVYSTVFSPLFSGSSVVSIADGYRFTLARSGGWPGNPSLSVTATSIGGSSATASASWVVPDLVPATIVSDTTPYVFPRYKAR